MTETPIEEDEVINEAPAAATDTEATAPVENDEAATNTTAIESTSETQDGTSDAEDDADGASFPEFMQLLKTLKIDTKKHEAGIKKFAEKCDMSGITNFINEGNHTPEEIGAFAKEALIGEEEDPQAGLKKIAAISGLLLEGLGKLGDFASDSTKDFFADGFGRLIDALIRGAGNNSSGSIRSREAESPAAVVGSSEFFKLMREDPTKAINGLLENKSDLKEAGWDIGDKGWEMLSKGKSDSRLAKEALLAVFVGQKQDGITSLAEHLKNKVDHIAFWDKISPIMAKIFGDDKKMVSLDIKEQFARFLGGEDPKKSSYFGQTN